MKEISNCQEKQTDKGLTELGKLEVECWTPCRWKIRTGQRKASNVESVHAFIADFDGVKNVSGKKRWD